MLPMSLVSGAMVSPAARRDLSGVLAYLGGSSSPRAHKFAQSVNTTLENLVAQPQMGSPRAFADERLHDLRVWPVSGFRSYLLFYRPFISGNGVEIIRVLHASRDSEAHLSSGETFSP